MHRHWWSNVFGSFMVGVQAAIVGSTRRERLTTLFRLSTLAASLALYGLRLQKVTAGKGALRNSS
uniref:HIG1 domain-containing protein n=1 Tax=Romanomermis culicivorax TaxID=13658 RepID=A0A915IGG4_ROMCU